MKAMILGIDLGTTNSEVAIMQEGEVQLFRDQEGANVIPSVISFTETGELLVGQAAKRQALLRPEHSVLSVKRLMGSDEHIQVAEQQYRPQAISAMILTQLKRYAEEQVGQPVNQAVITVPAYFSDIQRQATKEAGELAGLEVVRMINEPTAAALAYDGMQESNQTVLVYDLGGGTFDVSIVEMQAGTIEVIASTGNNQLGGDDFDQVLVDRIQKHLKTAHQVEITDNMKALSRVRHAAETAKITLSNEPYAMINEAALCDDADQQPVNLSLEISREDYEALIQSYVESTMSAVHQALTEAKKTVADIDEVLLVGGSTRTPLIRQRLKTIFQKAPRIDMHPDLCVAMGAAIQAGVLAGEKQIKTLVDITPYAFGTDYLDVEHFMPHAYKILIEKNSPLPVSKSEIFYPLHSEQESAKVTIYQGDDETDARNNIKLGDFMLKLSQRREGEEHPIVFNYHLDVNGILKVTATEKRSGRSETLTVEGANQQQPEVLEAAKEKIAGLFQAPSLSDAEDNPYAKAYQLIDKMMVEMKQYAAEDQDTAKHLIDQLSAAIERDDQVAVAEASEALSDLSYYLAIDT